LKTYLRRRIETSEKTREREEIIEQIRRSKDVVGYLQPVIVDADTLEIVDGKHRKQADTRWPEEKRKFKSKKEKLVYKIVSNTVRRTVSKKERQSQLLELALYLEDEGVPKEKMASEISKETGFSLGYVERLLPKKYKETRFAPKRKQVYVNLGRPPKIVTETEEKKIPEPVEKKPDVDRDIKQLANVSERVKWILQNSADDIDYKATIPTLTDPELKYCLTYETRKSGREQLESEWKRRQKAVAVATVPTCPSCHLELKKVLCGECWREISLKEILKEVGS